MSGVEQQLSTTVNGVTGALLLCERCCSSSPKPKQRLSSLHMRVITAMGVAADV